MIAAALQDGHTTNDLPQPVSLINHIILCHDPVGLWYAEGACVSEARACAQRLHLLMRYSTP